MKLFKHGSQWDTPIEVCNLGLGLKPQAILIEWFGNYYLAPRELLANGLEQIGIYRKLNPKDELPIVTFELADCIFVPQAVARILIDEYSLGDHQ